MMPMTLRCCCLGFALSSISARRLDLGFGVLQLIGIDFAIAAFLYALPLHQRVVLAGAMLVAYWAAIRYIPIPGVGQGVFAKGRNLIDYLNYTLLAPVGFWGLPQVVPTSALVFIGTLVGDLLERSHLSNIRSSTCQSKKWLHCKPEHQRVRAAAV